MKKLFSFALFLVMNAAMCGSLLAQPSLVWERIYAEQFVLIGLKTASIEDIAVDGDGNTYAVGYIPHQIEPGKPSFGAGNVDMLIIKLAPDGTELWKRYYNGSVQYSIDEAYALVLDEQHGYLYVTGVSDQTPDYYDDHTGSGGNLTTLKYTTGGTLVWEQHYVGPGYQDIGTHIDLDGMGNVYVAGSSRTDSLDEYGERNDLVILKYAPNGTELWTQSYNGMPDVYSQMPSDRPEGLAVDEAGNVHVTGILDYRSVSDSAVTLKYDTYGNKRWEYQGGGDDIALDMTGNIWIAGFGVTKLASDGTERWSNPGPVTAFVLGENGQSYKSYATRTTIELIKYDTDGNTVWTETYAPEIETDEFGNFSIAVYDVTLDEDGNVYILGSKSDPTTQNDLLILSFEADGTFRWEKTYLSTFERDDEETEGSDERGHDIIVDHDGNIFITGKSEEGDGDIYNALVLKYSQDGTPPPAAQSFWLEAECAQVGSAWTIQSGSTQASNGAFVVRRGGYGYQPNGGTPSYVSFPYTVVTADTFYFYARVRGLTSNSNSFWVSNGNEWTLWNGLPYGETYEWSMLPLSGAELMPGNYTLFFAFREPNTQLDKVYITTEPGLPTGFGEAAGRCAPDGARAPLPAAALLEVAPLQVYPNPVREQLTVESAGPTHVRLYNVLGVEVLSRRVEGRVQLSVAHLPAGIYMLHVEGQPAQRLLKQ
ncbi:Por secretion system C-terminal sorting domain-containing protein [Catalinimonas alkaloidigena]|uniref:Por secretion system C-terminal sorting domain-containing protein n=1 Tax=Catalinimonas alkaloidigena TaxID=1075417 RepID=A0A1G9A7C3_9BACT|nr:SBBP repeat-containing protein [Catalinimonas alkaloidigena]SDK22724.1 Por secretion system C-terminal sorting domain-containing protein [Catalinimonas alkaloidigena]